MKRSPLPPRQTPLKRTAIKRTDRKPIAQRSSRQRALIAKRVTFADRIRRERPKCEGCPLFAWYDNKPVMPRESVDVHEVIRRGQGGDILDEGNVVALCRQCHERCTNPPDPEVPQQLGLILPSWATPEMESEARTRRSMKDGSYMTRCSWHSSEFLDKVGP